MKVSIILPAYNEEKRIISRIQSIINYFDKTLGEYEVLTITDGCTDKTPELVLQCVNNNPKIKLLNFHRRLGKGGAVFEGLKMAKADTILIIDADDSISPEELFKLIKEAETQDVVIGSRYTKGSKLVVKESFKRYFLGRAFNAFTKLMFWRLRGINDTQCGCKVIKRYVWEKIRRDLFITGFAFDVNLIYSAIRKGFKVKEIGIIWKHIEYESKVSKALMKLIVGMFFSLIKLRLYYSRFRPVLESRTMKKLSKFLWNLTKA